MSATKLDNSKRGPYGDLEEQQYNTLYKTMDVPLMDIRRKYFKQFMIVSLLVLGMAIFLASVVPIPNYLQVPIVIENIEQDHSVMFNHSIRVKNYFVNAGEEVKKGEAICHISSPEIQNLISAIRVAQNDIQGLEKHDAQNIDVQMQNLDAQKDAEKNSFTFLKAEKRAATDLFNSRRSGLEKELKYLGNLKNKNHALYREGVISQVEYLRFEKDYTDKLSELSVLEKNHLQNMQQYNLRMQEVNENLVSFSSDQNQIVSNFETDKGKLSDQIELAKKNLQLFYGDYQLRNDELVLLAPKDGAITYLYPDNKLLNSGEILYRLEDAGGQFEANGLVAAAEIGYVDADMVSKIMLETFPHYEWGVLTGEIENISSSPNEEGQYTLSISLTKENPKISPLLQNGQTGTASLVIEQKSLFGYIFRDFKRMGSGIIY